MERLALSPAEAAEALGLGKSTVYKLIRRGIIPTVQIGTGRGARLLVSVEALRKLLEGDSPQPGSKEWLSREHERAFGEPPTQVQP
jgi:excisionase family DNA binding protein